MVYHLHTSKNGFVICMQEQFISFPDVTFSKTERSRSSASLPVYLTSVGCYGYEEKLINCTHHKYTSSTSMDISISCKSKDISSQSEESSSQSEESSSQSEESSSRSEESSSSDKMSTAALSIAVIIASAFIVLVAVLIIVIIRQRRKRQVKYHSHYLHVYSNSYRSFMIRS